MCSAKSYSGVIEGFYGPPWSHEARLSMIRRLGARGLTSYAYAPKRDPLHRGARWIEPYPRDELDRFAALVDAGDRCGVRVTVAVAPAKVFGKNNLARWGDRHFEALVAKLDALHAAGVRSFALLFDDTAATFVPSLGGRSMGRFHGDAVRRCAERLPDASFFLVPAVYSRTWSKLGGAGRRYWRALGETLPDGVPVAWTGPRVFSRAIRGADVRELSAEAGVPILIWNNAVVNDWVNLATGEAAGLRGWRKLSFGPGDNLDADVLEASSGVLLNGALEPELTKVSVDCFAEFAAAPASHDPEAAHGRALADVGGGDAGGRTLAGIYGLCRNHLLLAPRRHEAPRLYRAAKARDRDVVRAELEAIAALADEVEALPPPLREEVLPTVRKARLIADAVLHDRAEARKEARRIRWVVARKPFAMVHRLHRAGVR